MKTLEFKDKRSEVLTLDELKTTLIAEDAGGKLSKALPVDHFKVFDAISDTLNAGNIEHEVSPITVYGGKFAKKVPYVERHLGVENALQAHWLSKVYGEIILPKNGLDGIRSMIRVEYHDRGLSVSYGKHVLVCSNGMTAFRGDILSTYGSNKMDYEHILQIVESWVNKLDEKSEQYNKIITTMMETDVDKSALPKMIGKLQMFAVNQAYLDTTTTAPFNIGQVSSFTKGVLKNLDKEEKLDTVWDLYNVGTMIQKPNQMDLAHISENNFNFTNFICEEYAIPLV